MERVLVCLLAKTRGHDVTFSSFKRHVLDELQADLAVALTIDEKYDYANPYWQHAKYRWTSRDYDDYGDGFDFAQRSLCDERNLHPTDWRPLLRLSGPWAGRIRSTPATPPRTGASAILPFCRWLLLRGLQRDGVLDRYDRFVISRSDFVWLCPHPPLSILDREAVWVPDGQHWGGINDRHMVVSRADVESCLNGLEDMVLESDRLYEEMKDQEEWNEERFLAHHLRRKHLLDRVRVFPYTMYTARSRHDDSPTYSSGRFEPTVGHYIKYELEFRMARAFASVIRSRADWEANGWKNLDPSTIVEPQVGPLLRLWHRGTSFLVRASSLLKRSERLPRLKRLSASPGSSKDAAAPPDQPSPQLQEEWSRARAR
jgi:hypothetical protein